MADLAPTLTKKEFKNWLKGALALIFTKDALKDFVSAEVDRYHQRLLHFVPAPNMLSTCNCTLNSLPPCTRSRNHSHIVPGPKQLCSRGVCNILMDVICKDHRFRGPSWRNTDPQKWCTDAIEVAKCFFPPDGYSFATSLSETDFNGIISFIINNLSFTTQIQDNLATEPNVCTKARRVGREIRHTADHFLSDSDLMDYIDDLINLLSDPACLLNDPSAQDAVRKLRMLKANDLTIQEKDSEIKRIVPFNMEEMDTLLKQLKDATQKNLEIELYEEMKEKKKFEEKLKDPGKDDPLPSLEEARRELSMFPHDGRLRTPSTKIFESIIRGLEPLRSGGYGVVYLLNDSADGLGFEAVVKKIKYTNKETDNNKNSISCEKLASRTIHFAIVPLLAMAENIVAGEAYFLSPYLCNGDLEDWIRRDTKAIQAIKAKTDKDKVNQDRDKVKLTSNIRVAILYHVTAALDFLHMEISGYRGSILHMDLTSKNVVLDENWNARLIDFGLAREINEGSSGTAKTSSKMYGTPGYFQSQRSEDFTTADDYRNFGVVIREVLTGKPPTEQGETMLKELSPGRVIKFTRRDMNVIWKDESLVEKLNDLSDKCISKSKDLDAKTELLKLLGETTKWRPNVKQEKCEMCMVNTAATKESKEFLRHDLNCKNKINVCSACIRNSYLNPIICHSCTKELVPFIGAGWGALLIAGNDERKTFAHGFKEDILKVKRVIVSRCPLVMGLSENNVEVITPDEPGVEEDMMTKFKSAVENLKKKDVHTLLIYFSGHHYSANGFLLGKREEFLTVKKLQKAMLKISKKCSKGQGNKLPPLFSEKRFIVILDCCEAPDLTEQINCSETTESSTDSAQPNYEPHGDKSKEGKIPRKNYCIIQMNACRQSETTIGGEQGSAFTHMFIKCLTQRALDIPCKIDCKHSQLTGDFIRFDDLHCYISEHGEQLQICQPVKHEKSTLSADSIIAYNVNFKVVLEFKIIKVSGEKVVEMEKIEVPPIGFKNLQDLQQTLLEKIVDENKKDLLFEGNADLIFKFADCTCFEIEKGPKKRIELDSLDRLMAAWNSKREITISMRTARNIDKGKVLVYTDIEEAKNIKEFFKDYKKIGITTETETYVVSLKQAQKLEFDEKMPYFDKQFDDILTCTENKKLFEVQEETTLSILFPKLSEEDNAGTPMCLEVQGLKRKT